MGKAIEGIAIKRGHTIAGIIDVQNFADFDKFSNSNVDVAIEFTTPNSAYINILKGLQSNIPLVVGTTGWLDKMPEIQKMVADTDGTLCYSSNYSVGVNIFWAVNEKLAQLMQPQSDYDVTMDEIHHVYKKDAPSGTAITTAEGVIKHLNRKKKWSIDIESITQSDLFIAHKRIHNVPGTHTVRYTSPIDSIELTHTAFNREGFATGAVLAAEFIATKKGFFTMKDVLSL